MSRKLYNGPYIDASWSSLVPFGPDGLYAGEDHVTL